MKLTKHSQYTKVYEVTKDLMPTLLKGRQFGIKGKSLVTPSNDGKSLREVPVVDDYIKVMILESFWKQVYPKAPVKKAPKKTPPRGEFHVEKKTVLPKTK